MFLLVPAHPGSPQTKGRTMIVVVVVVVAVVVLQYNSAV